MEDIFLTELINNLFIKKKYVVGATKNTIDERTSKMNEIKKKNISQIINGK